MGNMMSLEARGVTSKEGAHLKVLVVGSEPCVLLSNVPELAV